MRINKFIALGTGMSRRSADVVVAEGRVYLNGICAQAGQMIGPTDTVTLDGRAIVPYASRTVLLNKPTGYVVSRDGQGSKTVYDLLPSELHALKPVGRLDKDSSGLLLLTNNGRLAQELTHPSRQKIKIYAITLDRPLTQVALGQLNAGVPLEDGPSNLSVQKGAGPGEYRIAMHEGRNRQIRRTFTALGYQVIALHRLEFGPYTLKALQPGQWIALPD